MKLKSIFVISLLSVVIISCSKYTITPTSLQEQLTEEKKDGKNINAKYSLVKYSSNNLEQVKCIDKNGKEVLLSTDKNTQIIFTKKDGSQTKAYFDTVTLHGDTLFSLASRISGGKQTTLVSEVQSIVITAEAAKTKPVK
ncbi:MAG TPA: hypothetical protein VF868_03150 [Bacteroidia bacterium]|jgi:hypothetical protein